MIKKRDLGRLIQPLTGEFVGMRENFFRASRSLWFASVSLKNNWHPDLEFLESPYSANPCTLFMGDSETLKIPKIGDGFTKTYVIELFISPAGNVIFFKSKNHILDVESFKQMTSFIQNIFFKPTGKYFWTQLRVML